MSNQFDTEWDDLLEVESREFTDDPLDSGRATKFGTTEKTARAAGYDGPMQDLPEEVAKEIAKSKYWDVMMLDQVSGMSSTIAHEMFDTGYNMGDHRATTFLQRSLNALNRSNREVPDYDEVVADGAMGPRTLGALKAFLDKRGVDGQRVMLRTLNGLQLARLVALTERREKDERFLFGWVLHRVLI